jgi:hypothetical protein
MSWILRGRELVFGTYNNLPTIFMVGSLLIGSMTGIVPILVLGLVTAFLGLIVFAFQLIMRGIVGTEPNGFLKFFSSTGPCSLNKQGSIEVLVSSWMSITSFVLAYLFLNALANYTKIPPSGANEQLVANRASYMISAMVAICIIAIILGVSRYILGCETYLMTALSLTLGIGVAYGMWNLVDLKLGDVFQIVNNMANVGSTGEATTPVLCVPSA